MSIERFMAMVGSACIGYILSSIIWRIIEALILRKREREAERIDKQINRKIAEYLSDKNGRSSEKGEKK